MGIVIDGLVYIQRCVDLDEEMEPFLKYFVVGFDLGKVVTVFLTDQLQRFF